MKKIVLFLFSFFVITACSHQKQEEPSWVEVELNRAFDRGIASENSAWVLHPCRHISGTPFRKYHSFIIEDGILYGRKSENGQKIEIKNKGPHDGKWESVEEFLSSIGANRCDGSVLPPKQENTKPISYGKFNPPITKNKDHYYEGFWKKYLSTKRAAKHFRLSETKINQLAKRLMHIWLSRPHQQILDHKDSLVKSCEGKEPTEKQTCVSPKHYNYEEARSKMYGYIDARQGNSERELFDYYCQRWIPFSELIEKDPIEAAQIDPEQIFRHIPNAKINVEHSWPQSKFIPSKDEMQRTDYHHIFPTDKEVNALRSNY